jgi:hypothetical protein
MIQRLQEAFNETPNVLYDLPEDYLQQTCAHAWARGGSARGLLVHNTFTPTQVVGHDVRLPVGTTSTVPPVEPVRDDHHA